MAAIYKRELKSYFTSLTGFVFVAMLFCLTGIYTMSVCLDGGYAQFEYVVYQMTFFYLLTIPILTMRSVSEEKKQRTDQLLYALPLSMRQIVAGKFLAMCTVLLIPVLELCLIPLFLLRYDTAGSMHLPTIYATILGYYLLGCALISIGMFLSSLTENQIVAAVLSFFAVLLCYLMNSLSNYISAASFASYVSYAVIILLVCAILLALTKNVYISGIVLLTGELVLYMGYRADAELFEGSIQKVLSQVSVFARLDNFVYDLFDLTSIVYYVSIMCLFQFFAVQALEKKRWS